MNGMLLAAGGAAVGSFFPMKAFGASPGFPPDSSIGLDPRVLRGGNLRSVFNVGHWLRDGRLTFSKSSVKIAGSPSDSYQGSQPILADSASYDVIIVGAGMSGLSMAFHIRQANPRARVLIIDGQHAPGGNANRDDGWATPGLPDLPNLSSTATAYAVKPYADFLTNLYKTVGINWQNHLVPSPFYSFYFDEQTPYATGRGWNLDTYGKGLKDVPYPASVVQELLAARSDFMNWYNTAGSPTDPADMSDPEFDYLSVLSLAQYLTQTKGFSPAVVDFYTRYAVDALAGTSEQVSAYTAISFIAAEYSPTFAFPGGNSGIARHIIKWLNPSAINGTSEPDIINNPFNQGNLDVNGSGVRIRQNCMGVRGETSSSSASVVYFNIADGNFHRSTAKFVVFAGQSHTARTACGHLLTATQEEALDEAALCPVVVANVALRKAAPVVDLGYDGYYWGSQYWADFVVSDWSSNPHRNDPSRPTVLTFYGGNTAPKEDMAAERIKLLTTPFSSYEESLRDDLGRVLTGAGRDFDFDRDVSALYLYRWGHSMIIPYPGWIFGSPVNRETCARTVARQPVGRIYFDAQDLESSPANESAIGAGLRISQLLVPLL